MAQKILTAALGLFVLAGCSGEAPSESNGDKVGYVAGPNIVRHSADAANGRDLFVSKGCVICHAVNGVSGKAAPALDADVTRAHGALFIESLRALQRIDGALAPRTRTPTDVARTRAFRLGAIGVVLLAVAFALSIVFEAPPAPVPPVETAAALGGDAVAPNGVPNGATNGVDEGVDDEESGAGLGPRRGLFGR